VNFCSAHYFDVDGPIVTYAWYGEGTRFLDISDPSNPQQFAYWRPDDTIVWASYLHNGYIYTADRSRGVDVLRFAPGASTAARAAGRSWLRGSPRSSNASWHGWPSGSGRIPAPPASASCRCVSSERTRAGPSGPARHPRAA
jgi:hypothetical protein